MNEELIRRCLLEELDAIRRANPQRAKIVGGVALDAFLERNRIRAADYLAVATRLQDGGLIAEPAIEQLSVSNGGVYVTERGLAVLDAYRRTRQERLVGKNSQPPSEAGKQFAEIVWKTFYADGRWPKSRGVEKSLLLRMAPGSDLHRALAELPKWIGFVQIGTDGDAPATLLGMMLFRGEEAASVGEDFWRAFTLCRHLFMKAGAESEATVTNGDLSGNGTGYTLGMDELCVRRVLLLLRSEGLLAGGSERIEAGLNIWSFQIADGIYRYRDAASLEDYLDLRMHEVGIASSGAYETARGSETPITASVIQGGEVVNTPDPRKVFVVHGRDEEAKKALFSFLRDLDLHPLEWEELVAATGSGSPFTGEVVARAFGEAQAVVVLFTPDDEARLHATLYDADEPDYERELTGQARPNVLLEAGMALGAQPDRTILLELGYLRPVSDLAGRNVLRLGKSRGALNALAERLAVAGCTVNRANAAWMDEARFASLAAHARHPNSIAMASTGSLPKGKILSSTPIPAEPRLSARLIHRGNNQFLLEVSNPGGVSLRSVSWEIQGEAPNWHLSSEVLPAYPLRELPPREYVRVPVSITMGGPVIVELVVTAITPSGDEYSTVSTLSIYG